MKTLAYAAAAALAAIASPAAAQDWNAAQAETATGHRMGNPEAELQLVEFISYTCPHCAHYTRTADAMLQLQYIPTGRVAVEVRPFIRNPVDMAATLLATCGEPDKFFDNHRALLARQDAWLAVAAEASPAQTARWRGDDFGASMRAVADDLGFYEIMEQRGYSITEADACLSDREQAVAIYSQFRADQERWEIPGTPSFVLNGELLEGVHSWQSVQATLDAGLQGVN